MSPADDTSLPDSLQQLVIDFEQSPLVMEVIHAEATGTGPKLYESPQAQASEPSAAAPSTAEAADGLHLDNDAFVKLAIDLLLTCAEDLVRAQKVLTDPLASQSDIRKATNLLSDTQSWLREEQPKMPLLSFSLVMQLLEEELTRQSLGQIVIPHIYERRGEMANWMLDDAPQARRVLSSYRTIFAPNDYMADGDEEFDFTPQAQAAQPMRPGM